MMQALTVRAGNGLIGDKCRACPSVVKVGQAVLVSEMTDAPYGRRRRFVVHVACVRSLIRDLPEELDATDLRERIRASGDPWA